MPNGRGTTHKDQSTRDVDDIEEHLPVRTELPVKARDHYQFLAGDGLQPLVQVTLEVLGGEVEPGSDYGEQAESNNLDRNTCQGDILAVVQLVQGVGVGRGGAGDHDGADELEEQGDDVAADEYGGDPTGCAGWQSVGFSFPKRRETSVAGLSLRGAHSSLAVLASAGTTWYTMRPKTT